MKGSVGGVRGVMGVMGEVVNQQWVICFFFSRKETAQGLFRAQMMEMTQG